MKTTSKANANRVIRHHLTLAGYSPSEIKTGITYAASKGDYGAREGFVLAVSRILYSDDQLADGAVFFLAEGYGPH